MNGAQWIGLGQSLDFASGSDPLGRAPKYKERSFSVPHKREACCQKYANGGAWSTGHDT